MLELTYYMDVYLEKAKTEKSNIEPTVLGNESLRLKAFYVLPI